jgi:tRNA(fMet)-specific endonuclease VapC
LCDVVDIDKKNAEFFGEVSAELRRKGRPIPTNDIWIAATVKQYNFTLITRDKHFLEVEKINIESW